MKTSYLSARRGSALITTIVFCTVLLLLIGSMLRYSASERRLNNRAKLLLEARTAAEAISEYGVAQVKNILESNRTFTNSTWSSDDENLFTTGSYAGTDVAVPLDTFWGGGHVSPGTGPAAIQPLLQVGKIQAKSNESSGLYYIDPTVKDNEGDPLIGKRVFRYDLDILSRAVVLDTYNGGNLPSYMKQTFSVRAVPLFTNAVYYNMDMEVQPGPDMTITGSTFCNSRMFVRSASASPTYITFAGPVTAVKGFWTNFHGNSDDNLMPFFQSRNESGALQTNATTGLVNILPTGDTVAKSMYITDATTGFPTNLPKNTWVESTWNLYPAGETWQQHIGDASATPLGSHTDTSQTLQNYSNWCQQRFNGALKTYADGVTPNKIQGIPDYVPDYGSLYPDPIGGATDAAYTYTSTGNDINNSAHALIETPRLASAASYNAGTEAIKYAHNVCLYIVANTTGTTVTNNGHKPDGTLITVPARSYRAFMNDTTTNPATITEVILPGQDTFGDPTTTSPYTNHKNARPIVQMVNIDFTTNIERGNTSADQRRMTDMRRTEGGNPSNDANTTFIHSSPRSATNKYVPKNLYMIDIDMTELKKAVQTIMVAPGSEVDSASEYYVTGIPNTDAGVWSHFIYNPSAIPTTVKLNDYSRIIIAPSSPSSPMTNAFTSATWNGAVYVESIAADLFDKITLGTTAAAIAQRKSKTHESHDSGVRLINGRGKVPSIDANVGFTIATNDAAYILGTFNADGNSNSPNPVAVLVPASPGASTGHNFEAGELPACVAADAITLLSQPLYTNSSGTFDQTNGWNDAYSGNTYSTSNYNTAWSTTPPSGSNMHDGTNASVKPFKVPYDNASGNWANARTTKLPPSFSEYSVAMLCGLVPTGKNGVSQTSGGLHNFPRFLEGWGVECRIRGSMVALFECRVATEPWNLRVYSPPTRVWGFNLLFDKGHMPPLTPKTIELRRIGANDITKAEYNAKLTDWGLTSKLLP